MRHVKTWGSRIIVLALIILAGRHWGVPLYKQYFAAKKTEVYIPTGKVQAGEFIVSFHEMGTLEAEKSVPVTVEVGGKLIYIVADGKVISKGDLIAELDTTDIEREVYNQTLEYKNRVADVDRANAEMEILKEKNKTELAQSQAELDFNKIELERAKEMLARKERLLQDKLVTGSEVDQAKLEVRSKELAVTKGEMAFALKQKEIESDESQKKAEIANVEFRCDMADSNLKLIEGRMKKAIIKAPAPGLVVLDTDWSPDGRRKIQEGDQVRPQQTICALPDLSSMLVKVKVGEADAPRVHLDMPTAIVLEAVPGREFHGTVRSISSLATEAMPWERGAGAGKTFEVVIAVKEHDPKILKPGMTADVEFISDSVAKAVYVPIEAVVERLGKTYVFVKEGAHYNRVQVKTGKQNDNYVVVEKELQKGQVIALRDPTKPIEEQEAGVTRPGASTKQEKTTEPPIPEQKK
jgi:RND family efflux transporter MFP subunit